MPNSKNPNHASAGKSIKVEPIRTLKDIQAIKSLLADKPRDLAIFTLGINTNMRAGDLLKMTIGQVGRLQVGDTFRIKDQQSDITMNQSVYEAIHKLLAAMPDALSTEVEYLFQSKKGSGQKLITPTLSNMVKQWCKEIGLQGNYGGESLRKTFGYHQLVTYGFDARSLAAMFGQNSKRKLFRYLCTQESDLKKPSLTEL